MVDAADAQQDRSGSTRPLASIVGWAGALACVAGGVLWVLSPVGVHLSEVKFHTPNVFWKLFPSALAPAGRPGWAAPASRRRRGPTQRIGFWTTLLGLVLVVAGAVPLASPRWSRRGSTVERNLTTSGARPARRPRRALRAPRTSPAGDDGGCVGSALIMYENGIHASYSQNFLSRRAAYRRGAMVVGCEATLEFDLAPMKLRIIHHRSEKVEQMKLDIENDGHGGGDLILAETFLDLVKGRAGPNASLRDGLLSAAMCLAARESARTKTFQPL